MKLAILSIGLALAATSAQALDRRDPNLSSTRGMSSGSSGSSSSSTAPRGLNTSGTTDSRPSGSYNRRTYDGGRSTGGASQ